LEKLWSPEDKTNTTSGLIRQRLIEICDKEFEYISTGLSNTAKRYRLPDNSVVEVSYEEGSSECISLRSRLWKYFDFTVKGVGTVSNGNGIVCAFVVDDSQDVRLIKHESILKLGLGETLEVEDHLLDYPQMLPNNELLNLRYAVDCDLPERPQIWLN
jgi:hypothetical protein